MSQGTLFVKQLKISEHDELRQKIDTLQGIEGEDTAAMTQMMDILASLITDENGELIFTKPEDIEGVQERPP